MTKLGARHSQRVSRAEHHATQRKTTSTVEERSRRKLESRRDEADNNPDWNMLALAEQLIILSQ
jgi:hypothetical protein